MPIYATKNTILLQLPGEDRSRLLQDAEVVTLNQRATVYQAGQYADSILFIESGMVSELIPMRDGRTADTCPMGRDGLAGMPSLLGQPSFHHCIVQIPGNAWRVSVRHVQEISEGCTILHAMIDGVAHARFCQATQFAACNLLHPMDARLARWLITAAFHARTEVLNITQQFVSEMLGANRSTTSTALNALQRKGIIQSERGAIRLVDPVRLRNVACECFEVVEATFGRLRSSAVVPQVRTG